MADLVERLRAKAYSVNAIMYPQESALLFEAVERLAALEAEASEGERRGLERAAQVADTAAKDFDNPHNHSLGVASDLMEACSDIASDIRALIPEAPVREAE